MDLRLHLTALLMLPVCAVAAQGPPPPPPPPSAPLRIVSSASGIEQFVAVDTGFGGLAPAALPIAPVALTGSGLVIGRVVDAGSGAAVAGAVVTVGSTGQTLGGQTPGQTPPPAGAAQPSLLRQLTDAEGRFAFRNLPAGGFSITAIKPGYADGAFGRLRPSGYAQPLLLRHGERVTDLAIRVFRHGVITGTVRDEAGEPVVSAQIRAYRRVVIGGRAQFGFASGGAAQTDDRGVYRMANLAPGDYVVVAPSGHSTMPAGLSGGMTEGVRDTMSRPDSIGVAINGGSLLAPGDRFKVVALGQAGGAVDSTGALMAMPTTYYPGVTMASQAQPIALASGEERAGIDLTLQPVATTTIGGHLVGPDGPAGGWVLHLVPSDVGAFSNDPTVGAAITSADGEFRFLGVAPGAYVIQTVRVPTTSAPTTSYWVADGKVMSAPVENAVRPATLWTATPVAVGAAGADNLTLTLQPGLAVSGRIEFDGVSERPPATRALSMMISLESADGRFRSSTRAASVTSSGQFTTNGYLPGPYVVRATNLPPGWSLKSAMLAGVDAVDAPIELADRSLSGLVVTLTDRTAALSGTVRDGQGRPDAGAAVAVFPLDRRLWSQYGGQSRRLRLTRASMAGAYVFPSLPPGDYGVVAFSEELAGEFPYPDFVGELARMATRVTIGDGDRATIELKSAVVTPPRFPFRPPPAIDAADSGDPAFETQQRDVRRKPAAGPATGAVSGVVIDQSAGMPVRRARVSVRAMEGNVDRAVMTDDTGRFAMDGVSPGRYIVTATKPGYLDAFAGGRRPGRGPGTSIAVAAGARAEVRLETARGGVVTGTIRDEHGAPLNNVTVSLRQTHPGRQAAGFVRATQSDDRGVYRIFGLQPGQYYLTASRALAGTDTRLLSTEDWQAIASEAGQASGAMAGDRAAAPDGRTVGYAPIFYPGTPFPAEAAPIAVAAGREAAIDLTVHLVRTARIEGVVTAADGRALARPTVMAFAADVSAGVVYQAAPRAADGQFSTPPLRPGRYTLIARMAPEQTASASTSTGRTVGPPAPPGQRALLFAEQVVDVLGEDVTGVTLVLQEGMTVSGMVRFQSAGGSLPPPPRSTVRLGLLPADPERSALGGASGSASPNGPFTLAGVPPGRFRFTAALSPPPVTPGATPSPPAWTLKAALVDGRDVLDLPLSIAIGQQITDVELILTDRMAELSGRVLDAAGAPRTDLAIALLAAERELWSAPSARRFRAPVQPTIDGRYRFASLPAGEYLLAALADPDPIDMTDMATLEQLAAGAIRITIRDGEQKVQDIRAGGSR
jgi:protocatechuate 3,4-dioxygenase beta subunit